MKRNRKDKIWIHRITFFQSQGLKGKRETSEVPQSLLPSPAPACPCSCRGADPRRPSPPLAQLENTLWRDPGFENRMGLLNAPLFSA